MMTATTLFDPALSRVADLLDDLEELRKTENNRVRILTRTEADADGAVRGFGLSEDDPEVRVLRNIIDGLEALEHQAELQLKRLMRAHPLGPWQRAAKGIGEKQLARLLSVIGDPYIRPAWERLSCEQDAAGEQITEAMPEGPRTVSQLWALCGYHTVELPRQDPGDHQQFAAGNGGGHPDQRAGASQNSSIRVAARRTTGQRSNWSTKAKTRAFLIAEKTVMQLDRTCRPDQEVDAGLVRHQPGCGCSRYRFVYDQRKQATIAGLHAAPCVRCGPKGRPAPVGSPWSAGHRHADALRITAKAILRDLWREARRIHETAAAGQSPRDTQKSTAGGGPTPP